MGQIKLKVCGITSLEDARVAIERGVEFVNFSFYRFTAMKMPRNVKPLEASE